MEIRKLMREENQEIKKLIKTSLENLNLDVPGTAYFDNSLNDLYSYYENLLHAAYWVAVSDGEVVGGIGIAPFDEEKQICELQKLYVREDQQGKGIANLLMDTALEFARSYYESCYLETASELVRARYLYQKYNFRLLDEPLMYTEHSRMDEWYLKKL